MRIDYRKSKNVCLKCPRYSEKLEFGKCIATKEDMLKCAWRKWQQMLEGVDGNDRNNI